MEVHWRLINPWCSRLRLLLLFAILLLPVSYSIIEEEFIYQIESNVFPADTLQGGVWDKSPDFQYSPLYQPPHNDSRNDIEDDNQPDYFLMASNRLQHRLRGMLDDLSKMSYRLKDHLKKNKPENITLCSTARNIDWDQACLVTSTEEKNHHVVSVVTGSLPPPPNQPNEPPKKLQGVSAAFTSLEGDTIFWPKMPIDNHDPDAVKQWMKGMLVSRPKDIVIVLDTSQVMEQVSDSPPKTRKNLASIAINAVLETLSTKDRVAVMTFPEVKSFPKVCSSVRLGFVTTQNKKQIEDNFLGSEKIKSTMQDYKNHNLEKAFQIFNNSEPLAAMGQRDKVILFFMGQSFLNQSLWSSIKGAITEGNRGLQNKVNVVGVTVGLQDEGNIHTLMEDLDVPLPIILSSKMQHKFAQKFHRNFLKANSITYTTSISPASESVIHVCKTVHLVSEDKHVGVLCLLIPRSSIEQDIDIPDTLDSYSFIIDSNEEIIYHKHLNPKAWAGDKVRFENLENIDASKELLRRILSENRGDYEVGNRTVVKRLGRGYRDGYRLLTGKRAKYIWTKLEGTSLTFCLVVINNDRITVLPYSSIQPPVFHYHRMDLLDKRNKPDMCTCKNQDAYCNDPAYVLTSKALNISVGPLCSEEKKTDVKEITNFMTSMGHSRKVKDKARDMYSFIYGIRELDEVTGSITSNRLYTWFYAGFIHGLFLIYPGVELTQPYFDHTQENWFIGAAAYTQEGRLIFSAGVRDSFNPVDGGVITISKVITSDRNRQEHLLGVQAVDVSFQRFRNLTQIYLNISNVFFINKAGYLVYHNSFHDNKAPTDHIHIMRRESRVGELLEEGKLLERKHCLEAETGYRRTLWEMKELNDKSCIKEDDICVYQFSDTNLYMVDVRKLKYISPTSIPFDENDVSEADICSGLFSDDMRYPLCPPTIWSENNERRDTKTTTTKTKCSLFEIECHNFETEKLMCEGFAYAGCTWCYETEQSDARCYLNTCPPIRQVITPTVPIAATPAGTNTGNNTVTVLTVFLSIAVTLVTVLMLFLVVIYIRRKCSSRTTAPLSIQADRPQIPPPQEEIYTDVIAPPETRARLPLPSGSGTEVLGVSPNLPSTEYLTNPSLPSSFDTDNSGAFSGIDTVDKPPAPPNKSRSPSGRIPLPSTSSSSSSDAIKTPQARPSTSNRQRSPLPSDYSFPYETMHPSSLSSESEVFVFDSEPGPHIPSPGRQGPPPLPPTSRRPSEETIYSGNDSEISDLYRLGRDGRRYRESARGGWYPDSDISEEDHPPPLPPSVQRKISSTTETVGNDNEGFVFV